MSERTSPRAAGVVRLRCSLAYPAIPLSRTCSLLQSVVCGLLFAVQLTLVPHVGSTHASSAFRPRRHNFQVRRASFSSAFSSSAFSSERNTHAVIIMSVPAVESTQGCSVSESLTQAKTKKRRKKLHSQVRLVITYARAADRQRSDEGIATCHLQVSFSISRSIFRIYLSRMV